MGETLVTVRILKGRVNPKEMILEMNNFLPVYLGQYVELGIDLRGTVSSTRLFVEHYNPETKIAKWVQEVEIV